MTSTALSAPTVAELEQLRAQREAASAAAGAPGSLAPQAFSLPADSGSSGDGTIQLELVSTGSFTEGARKAGGHRYLYATYRVRNAQKNGTPYGTPRRNLTFCAVKTTETKGPTAISQLKHSIAATPSRPSPPSSSPAALCIATRSPAPSPWRHPTRSRW